MYQYYYNLAKVYFKIKQFELAVDFYTSAIKINPSDPDIYSNRGICYIQIFQHKLAFADLQKALMMNPNDRVAHNGLSILMTVDPNIGE